MKAAVYTRYGPPDVVQVADVEKPVPKDDEVLIQVRAASVNPADWRLLKGVPLLFRILFRVPNPTAAQPGRLGHDVAGIVEAVGTKVSRFKAGDAVYGAGHGALAEYACALESRLASKPDSMTFEQAAAVPVAALSALQGLRDKGQIQPGQNVLINGAAGGVGTFAVQLAKSFGADVTGVCSTRNVEMVRSLGANCVVDYTREDCTQGEQRYDLILDNVGNRSLSEWKRMLRPSGRCVIVGAPKKVGIGFFASWLTSSLRSLLSKQRFVFFIAKINREDLTVMGELMGTGKVKAVIDRSYALSEAREAIRYLEAGHAHGKVIVTV